MKAAILREINKPLVIEEIDIADPAPHEILIRTAATGVCHTDLHFQNGAYPMEVPAVLGHESAGVVEKVGEAVTYFKPGDHAITCLSHFCGVCEHCLTGHMSLCLEPAVRTRPDKKPRLSQGGKEMQQFVQLGSFAEQMLVHEHSAVNIRKDMPLDRASLIGCAVTTGVGAVIHTAGVRPGETVAVIGCGGIGLSCINGAAIAGAGRIIAIDTVATKLELARSFGATDVVNAKEKDPVGEVVDMTSGGVHYSFEAVGLKQTTEQAFQMLKRGGTATVIGLIPIGTMVEFHGVDFLGEKKIQGSAMGSNRFRVDMPRFIEFYMQGKLHIDDMISRRIKLEDINEAFAELERGELARSIIMFD